MPPTTLNSEEPVNSVAGRCFLIRGLFLLAEKNGHSLKGSRAAGVQAHTAIA